MLSFIHSARNEAIRAVNTERVLMYWHICQRIFLEEQEGKDRADYGKFLIKTFLSSCSQNMEVVIPIGN